MNRAAEISGHEMTQQDPDALYQTASDGFIESVAVTDQTDKDNTHSSDYTDTDDTPITSRRPPAVGEIRRTGETGVGSPQLHVS